jgi:hypothetical protein
VNYFILAKMGCLSRIEAYRLRNSTELDGPALPPKVEIIQQAYWLRVIFSKEEPIPLGVVAELRISNGTDP